MILLLHGALGASEQFDQLRTRLDGHSIISPDFEGHGRRPSANRPFRIEHFVENAREAVASTTTGRVDIFGYSMGGYVALVLAATYPDIVSRVFTLGTMLTWSPDIAAREIRQLNVQAIREKVPRFAQALESRHVANGWEHVVSATAEMLAALGSTPLLTADRLAGIQCPVRLGVGDRDATVSVEETQRAMKLLARGEMEVFPNTPHPFERVPVKRLAYSLNEFFAGDGSSAR